MRRLVILLPPEDYQRLQALSAREERPPDRQAAHLLRRTLARLRLPVAPPSDGLVPVAGQAEGVAHAPAR
jgi:hypothetical protein